jgi:hypothetical protein
VPGSLHVRRLPHRGLFGLHHAARGGLGVWVVVVVLVVVVAVLLLRRR